MSFVECGEKVAFTQFLRIKTMKQGCGVIMMSNIHHDYNYIDDQTPCWCENQCL